jgi:DNA-binding transcriptional LysR family regulator
MDLRHVRTFVTVAELGTVSRAAQHLHIAQPALSRQISCIEQELGLKLFDRVGRRLVLSSGGEHMLSDCLGLLNHARAVGERAQLLRHGDIGVLKVAASAHLIEGIFPEFLQRYAKRYPGVQVKLVDAVGPAMLTMLERGEIHFAQTVARAVAPGDPRFAIHLLPPIDMLAACHEGLMLGRGATIEIADLAPHPLLQISSEYLIRGPFDAACRIAGFTPNIVLESRAPHALLAMAEAGHGVAIIPSALRTHYYKLRIFRVTYRGKPLREPLAVLSDNRRPLPPYATVFREMLAQHVRDVFPITRPSAEKKGKKAKPRNG